MEFFGVHLKFSQVVLMNIFFDTSRRALWHHRCVDFFCFSSLSSDCGAIACIPNLLQNTLSAHSVSPFIEAKILNALCFGKDKNLHCPDQPIIKSILHPDFFYFR
jgi:hypothetical protein